MIYFSSQQDTTYFHWQIETYLRNFESKGIDLSKCHVILLHDGNPSEKGLELQKEYSANFHFYPINPQCRSYIAAVKPYGMLQYFKEFGAPKEPIFYHDADIIFHELPDFAPLLKDDVSYMSKCLQREGMSYIDLEYLRQFKDVIRGLIEITGVTPKEHGGGAQYILKGTTTEYWDKVFKDCFRIYDFLMMGGTKVQIWCAEMWSTLWNLWYFDLETDLHPLLDFCMSRDPINELKPIIHNAGQMGADNFNKLKYLNSYPPHGLKVAEDMCNYLYYKEVEKISYIRLSKFNQMGKIQIIKEGAADKDSGHVYKLGEMADLGEKRNKNAVEGGFAVWVEEPKAETPAKEKKEGTPKKTTSSARGKKIETK